MYGRDLRFPLFLAGLLCALPAPAGELRLHRYTVGVDEALQQISVRACFDGPAPHSLVAESLDASLALAEARIEGTRTRLEPNGAELGLAGMQDDGCLNYRSALLIHGGRHQGSSGAARRVGPDVVTDVGTWLWRPRSLAQNEDVELRFILPQGLSVSAPWTAVRDAQGGITAYRLGRTPHDWPAAVAFGSFREREIDTGGARLRVALLHGAPAVEWDLVRQWLTRAAEAVSTSYGRFPVDEAQVVVVPGARGDEPVPWAFVLRGGRPALHFFINQREPLAAFMVDWTAVHEMSHLLLPYVRAEDAWLSEGLASYYQNVLRARAGMLPVAEAWQRMHAGFRRGMRSMPGTSLAAATERMHRDGAYMRVYWYGAALLFMADQRVRERTQGRHSLDTLLRDLRACCLGGRQAWQAVRLFAKLDQLSGTGVFSELYEQHIASTRFPDLAETYRRLGIGPNASGESIELLAQGPRIADRDAIMSPPSGMSPPAGMSPPFGTLAPTGMSAPSGIARPDQR
ncbi:MAG: hypothetical protein IT532_12950 [Burkholderiales bacterium]|nr:hypothetical protein [Burkholderiales bacterium]